MLLLPVIITLVGGILYFYIRPRFLFSPVSLYKICARTMRERRSRESLLLALAGTLGVGNIFGVSLGILVGGAGSLFWLVVSSFFSMIIKYSEVVMGFSFRTTRYGTPSVIRESYGSLGTPLSIIYAILGILLSLFMGAYMQSRSIFDTASLLPLDPSYILSALLVATLYFVFFGDEKIKKFTSFSIPLTTIIYIILAFLVIFRNFSSLLPTLSLIIKSAFSGRGVGGGIVGVSVRRAFSEGFLRGIMSNEAGAGTSLVAHSTSLGRTPREAGVCGALEVVFDSLVLCPLTGLAILTSGVSIEGEPMELVISAFSTLLGPISPYLILPIVFSFAYSTLASLYYSGSTYSDLVRLPRPVFSSFFIAFIILSSSLTLSLVSVIDLLLLLMTIPTCSCILKNLRSIRESV